MKPKKKCCANCAYCEKDGYVYLCSKLYYMEFNCLALHKERVATIIHPKIATQARCDKYKVKK